MTDANKLAESLRTMAQQTKNHRDAWRPHHYKDPLTFVRAGDLSDAADLIEAQHQRIGELLDQVIAAQARHIASEEKWLSLQQGWINSAQAALYGADDPHLSARFEGVV